MMRSRGLGLGGSMDNVIVMDDYKVLNSGGLRYDDEIVKHKILDAIGDLYLAGQPLIGAYHAFKSGHALNNQSGARAAGRCQRVRDRHLRRCRRRRPPAWPNWHRPGERDGSGGHAAMLIFRWIVFLLLVAGALSFAMYIATGQVRYRAWGLRVVKWTMVAALAFFAVLILERMALMI